MTRYASISFCAALLTIVSATGSNAASVTTNVGKARTSAPAANAGVAPVEEPIARSVFVIPAQPSEGRDPFYPKTIRLRTAALDTKVKPTTTIVADLKLNGLSGTAERPLAVINGVTFGNGDENPVPVSGGKVRVQCIEVRLRDETAIVEVAGERRELRLRMK
jgi:hypothetical protein